MRLINKAYMLPISSIYFIVLYEYGLYNNFKYFSHVIHHRSKYLHMYKLTFLKIIYTVIGISRTQVLNGVDKYSSIISVIPNFGDLPFNICHQRIAHTHTFG